MSKKPKNKQAGGFVDFQGRDVEFIPSFIPRIEAVIHAAILQTSGIDFGRLTIHQAVEAPRDNIPTLFVEVSQFGVKDTITFSIPAMMVNRAIKQRCWQVQGPRIVRNYRASRHYKILGNKPAVTVPLVVKGSDAPATKPLLSQVADQLN